MGLPSSHKLNQPHQNPNILTIPQTPTSYVLRRNQPIKFRQLPVCKQSRLIHLRMIHQQKFRSRFFHHMALNLILQNIRVHHPMRSRKRSRGHECFRNIIFLKKSPVLHANKRFSTRFKSRTNNNQFHIIHFTRKIDHI